MLVKELIEILNTMNGELEVIVKINKYDTCAYVKEIDVGYFDDQIGSFDYQVDYEMDSSNSNAVLIGE